MSSPKLLTVPEAAKLLNEAGLSDLSRKWLNDQIDRGKLPAIVIARKRRVRSDVVERMIDGWFELTDKKAKGPKPAPRQKGSRLPQMAVTLDIPPSELTQKEFVERLFSA